MATVCSEIATVITPPAVDMAICTLFLCNKTNKGPTLKGAREALYILLNEIAGIARNIF